MIFMFVYFHHLHITSTAPIKPINHSSNSSPSWSATQSTTPHAAQACQGCQASVALCSRRTSPSHAWAVPAWDHAAQQLVWSVEGCGKWSIDRYNICIYYILYVYITYIIIYWVQIGWSGRKIPRNPPKHQDQKSLGDDDPLHLSWLVFFYDHQISPSTGKHSVSLSLDNGIHSSNRWRGQILLKVHLTNLAKQVD